MSSEASIKINMNEIRLEPYSCFEFHSGKRTLYANAQIARVAPALAELYRKNSAFVKKGWVHKLSGYE
jgi:hypothetical protein